MAFDQHLQCQIIELLAEDETKLAIAANFYAWHCGHLTDMALEDKFKAGEDIDIIATDEGLGLDEPEESYQAITQDCLAIIESARSLQDMAKIYEVVRDGMFEK